jgi:protein-S-isoprenylcysteine O-methyltransferase Ste14
MMKANKLAVLSFLGMLNLAVMMGAAIFLPAMTFFYTQAWCYLAVFFGGVAIITIYIFMHDKQLLQSRLKVGSLAENRLAQKVIQGVASICFIGVYIISGFDHRLGWSAVPLWLWIFADVMLVVVMMLFFIVFRKNSFLSATIEIQGNQHMITDGPYSIVRHPMYSVAMLLFAFTPLALGSFWALTTFPLMILVLVFRCVDEEKVLSTQLDGYRNYCKKVRYRLIPFVW